MPEPFVPPPYPYDRLAKAKAVADALDGGSIDLSIGTPCDPPAPAVIAALSGSNAERGYPASIGTPAFRDAAAGWMSHRLGVEVPPTAIAACVGTKELVAGLPHWLRLRSPQRDTVLYPAVSYPSYAMGAQLAGCRAVPVPVDDGFRPRLDQIDEADAARALVLWMNTPGNPAGGLDDLSAAAAWGRARGVPVFSDECYVEFTWDGPPRTILSDGLDGLVAVHSLSKRSNLAGARVGFYAGDPDLVGYLAEVRKHAGLMVPGPVQAAAVAAWADQGPVDAQAEVYLRRLETARTLLAAAGVDASLPGGGFYLWAQVPDGDAWGLVDRLAATAGVILSPGEFYGPSVADHVRLAVVQPDDRLALALQRLNV